MSKEALQAEAVALWNKMHESGAITHFGEGYVVVKHQPSHNTCDLCRFMSIMDMLRKENYEHHGDGTPAGESDPGE